MSLIAGCVANAMILVLTFQLGAIWPRDGYPTQRPLKSYKLVSHETHERVLDIVFERDEANREYDFVLRFEPSSAPESQIIVKKAIGTFEVTEYRSSSGNIYSKLNSLMAQGSKEDAVEMAKLVQVEKSVIEVPTEQVRQWRRSLANAIGGSMKTLEQRAVEAERGVGTITLDGTFYCLVYDQIGDHFSIRLLDHEVSNQEVTGQLELVRWMNAVRLDVAKRRR